MAVPQTRGLKGPLCSSSFILLRGIYLPLVLLVEGDLQYTTIHHSKLYLSVSGHLHHESHILHLMYWAHNAHADPAMHKLWDKHMLWCVCAGNGQKEEMGRSFISNAAQSGGGGCQHLWLLLQNLDLLAKIQRKYVNKI